LALKEGREVGIIKNKIREAILEGEIPNAREEAIAFTIKAAKKLA
jgi:poly(A) polymerase